MNVHQGHCQLLMKYQLKNNNANDLQQELGLFSCFVLWQKSGALLLELGRRFWKVVTERKSKWWRWGFADLFTSGNTNMSQQREVCFTLVLEWEGIFGWVLPHCTVVSSKESFLKHFWAKNFASNGCSLGHMRRSVSVQGGQLSLARLPNGEYIRKILESTDHTLVPTHYKQLAGQVWHFPNFKRKKRAEQTCKERSNEHEHTSTKYIFFTEWGKKASLFTSLQACLKSNAGVTLQIKQKMPVLNWSWPSSKHLENFLLALSWYSARN